MNLRSTFSADYGNQKSCFRILIRKRRQDFILSNFKTKIEDYLILDSSSLYPNFLSAILRANATSNESTAKPVKIHIGSV